MSAGKLLKALLFMVIVAAICNFCALANVPVFWLQGHADSITGNRSYFEVKISQPIDSILVVKHFRHMYVYNNHHLVKIYRIVLGEQPEGKKHFEGDRKTPEGLYHINGKNPQSMAYKSLGISYPNDDDRSYARIKGLPTGGDIKIHGILNGYESETEEWMKADWTWGCIAVTNPDMDELFQFVKVGTPIDILP